jgi:hypothetical protein
MAVVRCSLVFCNTVISFLIARLGGEEMFPVVTSGSSDVMSVACNSGPDWDAVRPREGFVDFLRQSSSLYECCSILLASHDMSSEARFRRQYAILVTSAIEQYFNNASCPSVTPFDDFPGSAVTWEEADIVQACRLSVSVVKKQSELAERVGAGFVQPCVRVRASLSLPRGDVQLTSLPSDFVNASYSFLASGTTGVIRRLIRYRAFRKRIVDNFDDDTRSFVMNHPLHSALLHHLPRRLSLREYSFRLLLLNYWWVRLFGHNLPFWRNLHLEYVLAAAPACALELVQLETFNQQSEKR